MGQLAIVLHAHLPFVRHPEHPRSLEERWLFEAMLECYLPLLGVLERLERDRVPVALTMSLTPTLGDMLRDSLLMSRFEESLARRQALLRKEERRVAGGRSAMRSVVAFYGQRFEQARASWRRCGGDIVGALVDHAKKGQLDLLASAATHAFLPGLLPIPGAVRAQVAVGLRAFEVQTGMAPCGFWLPECAYHPDFDPVLGAEGVGYTVVEESALRFARPHPLAGTYAPILSPSGVAFFGRDAASAKQVWSRDEGYPGDPVYREYYRDIGFDLPRDELLGEVGPYGARVSTGLKYHRVTTAATELSEKEIYDPVLAEMRANEHAEDFVRARIDQLHHAQTRASFGAPPLIVAPYDAELFGHWWYEGPWFLEGVFRAIDKARRQSHDIEGVTLAERLRAHPAVVRALPAASTWGASGNASVWIDERNAHLWRHVHHATEVAMRAIEARPTDVASHQAAIEALLVQASDWPFIVRMQTTEGYALARVRAHAARARRMSVQGADAGDATDLATRDDLLAEVPIDWKKSFATR